MAAIFDGAVQRLIEAVCLIVVSALDVYSISKRIYRISDHIPMEVAICTQLDAVNLGGGHRLAPLDTLPKGGVSL